MSVAGTYDCIVKTPMGDQKAALTIVPSDDGTSFSGGLSSDMMGSMDIENGSIGGNTLSWKMKMTSPMPMDLDCEVSVDGDNLTGSIKAGAFGSMGLTGTRSS